ncbi:DNA-binding protein [Neptunitalea sp. Y10]|uniref:DNA-binding protein n=2 Tax=Neptunitalea lumnitzerae TaxID=2965509 RepID=A0ABQ5MKJ9_9FLAO|nr:DNA-binding protein [Neptunitalea sp. Y10]
MEQNLSFDQLPKAVTMLTKEVSELKSLLLAKKAQTEPKQTETWFDLNDLVKYDPEKRTKPTWYSKISRNEVPYYKRGKKVYFLKSEIDEWLKTGKRKTNTEIEQEAQEFLSNKKKGLHYGK